MNPPGRHPFRSAAIAGATLLVLGLSACSSDDEGSGGGSGTTALTLQTSWVPAVEFGGSYVAEANGYFEDEGLDVEIRPGGPDVDPTALLASGRVDIALAEPDNVARANANGADLVIIGATFQKNPLALLSAADTPISEPGDMVGKTIGVPAIDIPQHEALMAMHDVDEEQVTSVPAQFDVSPIVSGEVDGLYVYYTQQPLVLAAQGIEPVTMLLADYGQLRYGDVFTVTRETLDTRFDDLVGFMRAHVKGWEDYVEDQSQAVDLAVDEYGAGAGLDRDQQTETAALQVELIATPFTEENGLLAMSADDIEQNLETIEAMGVEGADDSLFDTSVMDAVADAE